jgi:hypothetical protein
MAGRVRAVDTWLYLLATHPASSLKVHLALMMAIVPLSVQRERAVPCHGGATKETCRRRESPSEVRIHESSYVRLPLCAAVCPDLARRESSIC